ncbi:lipoprotein signal peptidase [Candidatus Liberibacter solanacearum]|uniref:Lipoprotein signal peptidase n=1 Tax=Candidatus Liberibacter solanacearum TaxID=556287 RepID=A0A095BGR1_9HYPH|nr:signal peptidase II [Candidatus Liberibacter solanacearum]KGB27993.1 lipoprotein signal peptidase [Candidatus Liberibacter solanacearum]KJZ80930.1 lipoprotein signal peptidase [Candidatus Liberibacter solanacearum]KJZ82083.1 Lipoprotein signal peptidase [Candidatus Liberibacter solanacearum]KQC49499.1 lipoprotein signal peptidase [Candidatus Liberibacter solanacearum]
MISCRRMIIFSLIVFFLTLDQLIKIKLESVLTLHEPKHIFSFLFLYLTHNTGVSFSMLSNISPKIIISIRILITSFIVFIWRKSARKNFAFDMGYILIIAGAVGNIIDHYLYGYVIDYVMLRTQVWSFAIFNLADFLISLGACILICNESFASNKKNTISHKK